MNDKPLALGYKAWDPHELACHAVAEYAGVYARYHLDVRLIDSRAATPASEPDCSVACGAAALRWVNGEHLRVVFVATARPMFRLCAAPGTGLGHLRGRRIATWPAAAPPARLLKIFLEDQGLDASSGVTLVQAADDAARLAMVASGRADAALLSSACGPSTAGSYGLSDLAWLGDYLRFPTTGLAVTAEAAQRDADRIEALRAALIEALALLRSEPRLLTRALQSAGLVSVSDADWAAEKVRNYCTADGHIAESEALPCLARMADSLSLALPENPKRLYEAVLSAEESR